MARGNWYYEGIQVNPSVEEVFARIGPGKDKINYDKREKVFTPEIALSGHPEHVFHESKECVNIQ